MQAGDQCSHEISDVQLRPAIQSADAYAQDFAQAADRSAFAPSSDGVVDEQQAEAAVRDDSRVQQCMGMAAFAPKSLNPHHSCSRAGTCLEWIWLCYSSLIEAPPDPMSAAPAARALYPADDPIGSFYAWIVALRPFLFLAAFAAKLSQHPYQ